MRHTECPRARLHVRTPQPELESQLKMDLRTRALPPGMHDSILDRKGHESQIPESNWKACALRGRSTTDAPSGSIESTTIHSCSPSMRMGYRCRRLHSWVPERERASLSTDLTDAATDARLSQGLSSSRLRSGASERSLSQGRLAYLRSAVPHAERGQRRASGIRCSNPALPLRHSRTSGARARARLRTDGPSRPARGRHLSLASPEPLQRAPNHQRPNEQPEPPST